MKEKETKNQTGLSIFHKLLFGFIGTSLIIILIMGSVFYYYAKGRMNEYVKGEISAKLKNAISFFESNYRDPIKSNLTLLESSPSFDNFLTVPRNEIPFVRFDIEKMLHRLSDSKDYLYRSIVFFNAFGQEKIGIINKKRIRKFSSISEYEQGSPYDQGKARLFNRLTKSPPGTVLFEGPFKDSEDKQIVLAGISKREPEIAGFGGVIMLSCDLTNFITHLSNIKFFNRHIAWLYSENGNVLLSPPNRRELVDPLPYLEKENHLNGDTTSIHFHESFVHCTGCVLDSSSNNSLKIVFSLPHDIFSDLKHEILFRALIVIALVLCVAIIISYVLAKQFVRPIIELSQASKLLGRGNFQVNINTDSGGEIGELAWTFDKMAKELQQTIEARDLEIVNRKKAEKESLKAKAEWERSFNAITDIVSIQDTDMNIIRINKAGCEFLGLQPEEIIGKKCYEIFSNRSEPCLGCPELETFHDTHNHSQIIVHENLKKTFHVSTSPIMDAEKNIEYIVHVAKDITDQKKLEEELFQSQKMEAIGTLAGGIAHDFNNILSVIVGYSELVQANIESGTGQPIKDIDEIITAGKRASDLVKQILTFSRKTEHHTQPLSPHLIVKEALKMLRSSLPTTITIEQNIDSKCGQIQADPTKIHQIVVNLCTNAVHAMEDEKGTLSVSLVRKDIGAEQIQENDVSPGDFIVLSISDTGHGMNQETMKRIFEPYFTTKEVGKGTGLGLAVIHGIIKEYKGFIKVKSEPGKGTTFQVHLPAMEKSSNFEGKTSDKVLPLPTGTERILVVDDEDVIVTMNKTILGRLGYAVTATTDSLDALAKIRTNPEQFDLVITDQTMPNMTGFELAQEILQIKATMPIILSTGYSSVISEDDALAAGIKKYAKKPLSRATLAKIVRQVLDGN